MLPVFMQFEWEKIGSFKRSDPYTIAFVHILGSSFVMKGGYRAVKEYIEANYTFAVVYFSIWRNGKSRIVVKVYNPFYRIYFYRREYINAFRDPDEKPIYSRKKWELTVYDEDRSVFRKSFRNLPQSWIRELNRFI